MFVAGSPVSTAELATLLQADGRRCAYSGVAGQPIVHLLQLLCTFLRPTDMAGHSFVGTAGFQVFILCTQDKKVVQRVLVLLTLMFIVTGSPASTAELAPSLLGADKYQDPYAEPQQQQQQGCPMLPLGTSSMQQQHSSSNSSRRHSWGNL